MKRIILWSIPIGILFALPQFVIIGHARQPAVTSPSLDPVRTTTREYLLRVTKVVDGDTVDVMEDGEVVRIRLIGINTPETVDPRRPVECYGKEASARTRELLSGGLVRIDSDPTQGAYDRYGRRLAYIFLPDGTFVNRTLVQEGYAYEYTYHLPYKYQRQFQDAERDARKNARGLWSLGVCGGTEEKKSSK